MTDNAVKYPSRTTISNTIKSGIPGELTQLSDQAGKLRDASGMLKLDVEILHLETLSMMLDEGIEQRVREDVRILLSELTEVRGLGWSEIARLVGVSVPAIRKWRTGGDISAPKRHALAKLCAFLDLIEMRKIADPAVWLGTPLSIELDQSLTKAVLYAEGNALHLLAYADDHMSLLHLLSASGYEMPEQQRRVEMTRNYDGSVSIVPLKESNVE